LLNQKVNLGIAGSLVNLMIVMGTVFVGIFYFHETLTSVQYIGLFLALVAIALLNT
jgi:multidrug transporter EmrE-like cation transporter